VLDGVELSPVLLGAALIQASGENPIKVRTCVPVDGRQALEGVSYSAQDSHPLICSGSHSIYMAGSQFSLWPMVTPKSVDSGGLNLAMVKLLNVKVGGGMVLISFVGDGH